jgi:hypothetical protein
VKWSDRTQRQRPKSRAQELNGRSWRTSPPLIRAFSGTSQVEHSSPLSLHDTPNLVACYSTGPMWWWTRPSYSKPMALWIV